MSVLSSLAANMPLLNFSPKINIPQVRGWTDHTASILGLAGRKPGAGACYASKEAVILLTKQIVVVYGIDGCIATHFARIVSFPYFPVHLLLSIALFLSIVFLQLVKDLTCDIAADAGLRSQNTHDGFNMWIRKYQIGSTMRVYIIVASHSWIPTTHGWEAHPWIVCTPHGIIPYVSWAHFLPPTGPPSMDGDPIHR